MAHAHRSSIATIAPSGQPDLNRPLRHWLAKELQTLRPAIAASAKRWQTDRYRKHFTSYSHACFLLFHGLLGSESLRGSYAKLRTCRKVAAMSDLLPDSSQQELSVSYPQVAASNTSREEAFLAGLIPPLLERVRQLQGVSRLPATLRVLDSTFLRLSLKLYPWLDAAQRRVQLQVLYTPASEVAEVLLLAMRHLNDYQGMKEAILDRADRLAQLCGCTLTFDLGYYSHHAFAALLDAGVHIVTRLSDQARYVVLEEAPLQLPLPTMGEQRITITHDQRILLGSPNNRRTPRLLEVRLVTASVRPKGKRSQRQKPVQEYRILTDRWDLEASEVIQLYLWRWAIETFFLWLKRTLHLLPPLGHSQNAVKLSVWLSIIVHLLLVLAAHALGLKRRSKRLLEAFTLVFAYLSPADAHVPP